ncbi:hypothetical protein [Streptomyces sp. Ag109_G2-15]|uniref:hypothetical protein n=1 Tax=Streptomyces sp. Ag109_G2-15 TaxID=1938850 RepID=UPI000BC55004|nr:hypothetical protein [Streptomyces sp. Ag109_G2-15]SOD84186.1 hypothetical protein SAMN06272765_1562 [Streptomyces sp. Ag109_G2-15]
MTPISAQPGTAETDQQAEPAETAHPVLTGIRRGRHRKPRPRKVLMAAGGLALAAGVLSLVRVAPESGVGAPGTAEAEPRLDPGGTTEHAPETAATDDTAPTALPSATSVMGGVSAVPTTTATTSPTPSATPTTLPGGTDIPTTIPTGAPQPTSTPSTTAPRPSPTTPTPTRTPTPTPSHSTPAPEPGGVCVPVISLCVDLPGARQDKGPQGPEGRQD